MDRYFRTRDTLFSLDGIRTASRDDTFSSGSFRINITYKGISNISLKYPNRTERDEEWNKLMIELEKRNKRSQKDVQDNLS